MSELNSPRMCRYCGTAEATLGGFCGYSCKGRFYRRGRPRRQDWCRECGDDLKKDNHVRGCFCSNKCRYEFYAAGGYECYDVAPKEET